MASSGLAARAGDAVTTVDDAVRRLTRERQPILLAVSGGLDSMVLLDSAALVLGDRNITVATFDHRTGEAARSAARLVVRRARALGLRVEAGVARQLGGSEADWRRARWSFLRTIARGDDAIIVTAHTRDDQVETVLLRALRGAGARGLAGLRARSAVRRPFLSVSRAVIHAYAEARGIEWMEDPSNRSLRHRRNRVRHEILPALRRVRPDIDQSLVSLAERAASWRTGVERLATRLSRVRGRGESTVVHVAAADLRGYDRASLAVLWPAVAARAGVALDWRGTERLVGFTTTGVAGGRIQLAGGWEVVRGRDGFLLRRAPRSGASEIELPLAGAVRWGRWSFFPRSHGSHGDPWHAALPDGVPVTVRAWAPGDRMRGADGRPRRVKRFLRDAGIAGTERSGWPVVVAGGEIVWIPGVRRSDAATERSGRPGVFCYCEFDDDWRAAGR